MGFFVMLTVTLIVFFILLGNIGALGSTIISGILLFSWYRFNIRASTTSLIRKNMKVYFFHRARGTSHKDAMDFVIQSGYPSSIQKQEYVKAFFNSSSAKESEKEELKTLVWMIFENENGKPPTVNWTIKINRKINDTYNSLSRKYSRR